MTLVISDLKARVGSREILRGVDLIVETGEIHAVMGPNGSGKSTLCHVLSGREGYDVTGSVRLDDRELLGLEVDERARHGLVQAFQYPVEIPGVSLADLLKEALEERERPSDGLLGLAERMGVSQFLSRSVNDDLSGGEQKRSEMYQIAALRPRMILLDEIDSGLDIDAVRDVASVVEGMRGPEVGVLLITHYSRILRYVIPDKVHVMMGGKIVESGGPEIADELEDGGYEKLRQRRGIVDSPAQDGSSSIGAITKTPFD